MTADRSVDAMQKRDGRYLLDRTLKCRSQANIFEVELKRIIEILVATRLFHAVNDNSPVTGRREFDFVHRLVKPQT